MKPNTFEVACTQGIEAEEDTEGDDGRVPRRRLWVRGLALASLMLEDETYGSHRYSSDLSSAYVLLPRTLTPLAHSITVASATMPTTTATTSTTTTATATDVLAHGDVLHAGNTFHAAATATSMRELEGSTNCPRWQMPGLSKIPRLQGFRI